MEEHSILGGKYILREKIGSGSFGDVHNGYCSLSSENVALKIEKSRQGRPSLESEYRVLRSLQGGIGIPRVFCYGTEGSSNIMALELLGPSLESHFKSTRHKFSLKTVLMIADQCISRLEYIHTKTFIHRDIKPDNFLVGLRRKSHVIYIVDFGLAKRFVDSTSKHIKYKEGKSLTGTARFVSVFTHLGIEQSRRDDLESLGYLLLYLLQGTLPWVGIPGKTKQEKYKQIGMIKSSKTIEELVNPHPKEFMIYLNYVKSLKFEQKPDYSYLKKLFKELFSKLKFNYDYIFDWDLKRAASPRKNLSVCHEKPERGTTPIREFHIRRGITPLEMVIKREASPVKDFEFKDHSGFFTSNNFFGPQMPRSSMPFIELNQKLKNNHVN
jgi:serine/threonine protein kinase